MPTRQPGHRLVAGLVVAILSLGPGAEAQGATPPATKDFWTLADDPEASPTPSLTATGDRNADDLCGQFKLQFDRKSFEMHIDQLPPARFEAEGKRSSVGLWLPTASRDGGLAGLDFEVTATDVLAPRLARKYPKIRTLAGHSSKDPALRVRLTWSSCGLHARIFRDGRACVILPTEPRSESYMVAPEGVLRSPRQVRWESFSPRSAPPLPQPQLEPEAAPTEGEPLRIEGLATYRLAVATTWSFAEALRRDGEVTRERVLAVISTAVNSVNEVFERDLGVRLQVVPETEDLIVLDPRKNPFTATTGDDLLIQSQALFDCAVGADGYDVGHTFNHDGWSIAIPKGVGIDGWKGQGTTGVTGNDSDPGKNLFDLAYFAHELGHQFGAGHTYTGLRGDCYNDFDPKSAVEPGSGSTLMSYAGLCGNDDLEARYSADGSDAYFHARSIAQIVAHRRACSHLQPTVVASPFGAPDIDAGAEDEIPWATNFLLSPAVATEADHMTFNWEQVNQADRQARNGESCCAGWYRSMAATAGSVQENAGFNSPCRSSCALRFAFTARDNRAPGVLAMDHRQVLVRRDVGPFEITAPKGGESYTDQIKVVWSEEGTRTELGVETVELRLLCSNGDQEKLLARRTTVNDGAETWSGLETRACDEARVEVHALDKIFFARSPTFVLEELVPVEEEVETQENPEAQGR